MCSVGETLAASCDETTSAWHDRLMAGSARRKVAIGWSTPRGRDRGEEALR